MDEPEYDFSPEELMDIPQDRCPYCHGAGVNFTRHGQAFNCPDCHGNGYIEEE